MYYDSDMYEDGDDDEEILNYESNNDFYSDRENGRRGKDEGRSIIIKDTS